MEIEEYGHKVVEKDGEYVCCLCGIVFERCEVHGEWLASNDRGEPEARNVVSYIRTMSEEQREIRAILKSMRGNRLVRDNSRYLAELLHKKRDYRCINLNHIVPEYVMELTALYMRAVGAKIIKGTMLYILITEAMPWLSDEDKQRIKLGVLSYTNRKNGRVSNKYGVKTAKYSS
jgi:transcription initiation factor TFIIIB Brf1 subunit/transcription initiation factor TFIIB